MWTGIESRRIEASAEAVWAVVTDVSRHAELAGSREIKSIRVSDPIEVGTTWEADEKIPGAPAFTARSRCTVFDPPRELAWTSTPPPMRKKDPESIPDISWWYRLSPTESGVNLEHGYKVVPPPGMEIPMRLFYLVTRRPARIRAGMQATLRNIERAVAPG